MDRVLLSQKSSRSRSNSNGQVNLSMATSVVTTANKSTAGKKRPVVESMNNAVRVHQHNNNNNNNNKKKEEKSGKARIRPRVILKEENGREVVDVGQLSDEEDEAEDEEAAATDNLSSVSETYLMDDLDPCPVSGCPLNPRSSVRGCWEDVCLAFIIICLSFFTSGKGLLTLLCTKTRH